MKSNFEKQIKESIDKLDFGYNPKSWDAMRKRLDTVKPVSKLPLYLTVGGAAALITGGILFYNHSTSVETKDHLSVNTTVKNDNPSQDQIKPDSDKQTNTNSQNSSDRATDVVTNENESHEQIDNGQPNANVFSGTTSSNTSQGTNSSQTAQNGTNTGSVQRNNPEQNQTVQVSYIAPVIESVVCEMSVLPIQNTNNRDLIIIDPNGKETICPAKASINYKANKAGAHTYGIAEGNDFVSLGSFAVLEKPSATINFLASDEKYDEKGLPVKTMFTDDIGTDYVWNVDGITLKGKEVKAYLFKKEDVTVKLTVTAANGCKATNTSKISVEENYNLIAVNSFVPSDADPKLNTFMPYALKLRNTPFRLIIIDPNDGHTLYETTDANLGWDGIDRQTGQLVPYEKAYIWKVVLDKHLPNESPEYAGTVIPISRRH